MDFKQKVFSIVIFRIIYLLSGIIIGALLARILGPTKLGLIVIVMFIPQYAEKFGRLGLGVSAIYHISKKKISVENSASLLWSVSFGIGMLPLILLPLYEDSFRGLFLKKHDISSIFLYLVAFSVPANFLTNYFSSIVISKEKIFAFNLIKLTRIIPGAVSIILLLVTEMDIAAVIISYTVGTIFSACLVIYFYFAYIGKKFDIIFKKTSDYLMLLRYGVKIYLSTVMEFVHTKLDIFLIALLLSPKQVAFYNLAVSIGEKLLLLNVGNSILFVRVSSSEGKEREELTAKLARNTFFLTSIIAGGISILAEALVQIVYGSNYLELVRPLQILLPGIVLMSMTRLMFSYFNGINKVIYTNFILLFSILLNLSLNLYLIPVLGITGAALATMITYSIAFAIAVLTFLKITSIGIAQILIIDGYDCQMYMNLIKNRLLIKQAKL